MLPRTAPPTIAAIDPDLAAQGARVAEGMRTRKLLWCCVCCVNHAVDARCPEHRLPVIRQMWPGLYARMEQCGEVKDNKYAP